MGRRKGAFKAEKRRKELKRLAKQNAKAKRRQAKSEDGAETTDELGNPVTIDDGTPEEGPVGEGSEEETGLTGE